jgi:hypothetical protein
MASQTAGHRFPAMESEAAAQARSPTFLNPWIASADLKLHYLNSQRTIGTTARCLLREEEFSQLLMLPLFGWPSHFATLAKSDRPC